VRSGYLTSKGSRSGKRGPREEHSTAGGTGVLVRCWKENLTSHCLSGGGGAKGSEMKKSGNAKTACFQSGGWTGKVGKEKKKSGPSWGALGALTVGAFIQVVTRGFEVVHDCRRFGHEMNEKETRDRGGLFGRSRHEEGPPRISR